MGQDLRKTQLPDQGTQIQACEPAATLMPLTFFQIHCTFGLQFDLPFGFPLLGL